MHEEVTLGDERMTNTDAVADIINLLIEEQKNSKRHKEGEREYFNNTRL